MVDEDNAMPPVVKAEMFSGLMQRRMPYNLIFPDSYNDTAMRCPVLYLLHGLFGSFENWAELTAIGNYASGAGLIIVMPEGGNGWYTDSESIAADRYESYLIKELIPHVDRQYRTIARRGSRAIAGISMGGYGALKIAVQHPDKFALAGSVSGALDAAERIGGAPGFDWETLGESILRAFGAENSSAREHGDLFKLVANLTPEAAANLPLIYLDCGADDGFIHTNRKFAGLLREKGIRHEYREGPGGHDWDYWNARGRHIVAMASAAMKN